MSPQNTLPALNKWWDMGVFSFLKIFLDFPKKQMLCLQCALHHTTSPQHGLPQSCGALMGCNLPFQGRLSKPQKRSDFPLGCHTKHLLILHMLSWPLCPSWMAAEKPKWNCLKQDGGKPSLTSCQPESRVWERNSPSSLPAIPFSPASLCLWFGTWRS